LNPKLIYRKIKEENGIKNGRLIPTVINTIPYHSYIKDALISIRYPESQGEFSEMLEAAVFNIVGNHGIKLIDKMHSRSHQSATRLKRIATIMRNK